MKTPQHALLVFQPMYPSHTTMVRRFRRMTVIWTDGQMKIVRSVDTVAGGTTIVRLSTLTGDIVIRGLSVQHHLKATITEDLLYQNRYSNLACY